MTAAIIRSGAEAILKKLENGKELDIFRLSHTTFERAISSDDSSSFYQIIPKSVGIGEKPGLINVLDLDSGTLQRLPGETLVFFHRYDMVITIYP